MIADKTSILIVDDEFAIRDSLRKWFETEGYSVKVADSAEVAERILKDADFDIVLLDIKMPGMNGIEFNRKLQNSEMDSVVIMMTAYASVDSAVRAIKDGAYDYISKPADPDEIAHIIRNAMEKKNLSRENTQLRERIKDLSSEGDIIGSSPQMKRVAEMIDAVARTDATVMVRGESGTGKELVARAIHYKSSRRNSPIITVNCGALTDTLLESELFGHERGAFTGAVSRRLGKLERADLGTVFFDEIGNISARMQMDLLRVVESKKFTRVGGEKPITVDFRIISATNRNLEEAVATGDFREDLYFRLNVLTIDIPPLRERSDDIPQLVEYFLKKFAKSLVRDVDRVSPEAMEVLCAYEWPGNVRELRNVLERAIVLCRGSGITPQDLSFPYGFQARSIPGAKMSDVERTHIASVLERTDRNISQAARMLDIDRTTLYNKMRKYGLDKNA
jgi:DNA-binding NtrC family response regulator